MSMGVVYALTAALQQAIERVRKACGANCTVAWIRRRDVRPGDYVVTAGSGVARVKRRQTWSQRVTVGRTVKLITMRKLWLSVIWPERMELTHTRPQDAPLKAAFRLKTGGLSNFEEDEIDIPGGMGDVDFNESPLDEARFPLHSGDLPDTTFVTQEGLERQEAQLGWFLTQEALRWGTTRPGQQLVIEAIPADPLWPITASS